ncbi:MAG: tyrosine-type recombinase/integrase [Candidatus Latescibacteria bacterium]|nr:tyrosine-type recombinase/integrase [Candidatus Latescibacterota bacterium]MBT3860572.1 tyrosine-type recombinase/integrase [Gammaproteobacteria bacterium]MBT4140265.1 tyrosine-type recombinase/integrase [Candidatus Latescibacterota bacterium]MBT5829870.1 tyrosine-type recombinase/integrase [Candidatus Latescibacterota bacterium]
MECEIHQLRHTAATTLMNSGVGIGTVRRLLGHRNLQTTQRYAELADETVRQELEIYARRKRKSA